MTTLVKTNTDNVFGYLIYRPGPYLRKEFITTFSVGDNKFFGWTEIYEHAKVFFTPEERARAVSWASSENGEIKMIELIGRYV